MALLVAAGGCGSVPEDGTPDAGGDARPPPGSTVYRATMATLLPVAFGGNGGEGMNFCDYSIELRQVELEMVVSTTGAITGGTSQALAVEMITGPGAPNCIPGPATPANIHKFTFKSATTTGTTTKILMDGAIANAPRTNLEITVAPTAGAYSAAARWMRPDPAANLAWVVSANLTMTVKP
jgi:hypothetical protein